MEPDSGRENSPQLDGSHRRPEGKAELLPLDWPGPGLAKPPKPDKPPELDKPPEPDKPPKTPEFKPRPRAPADRANFLLDVAK